MSCCQCAGIEKEFNDKYVNKAVKGYYKKGSAKNTKMLISMLKETGVKGETLLDIGGGVGAIQIELFKEGLKNALAVDASPAFLNAAKKESKSQGFEDLIKYYQGNFVDLAKDLENTSIVTLDKVICCYDDMEALVKLSAKNAQLYGLIFPRDTWWVKTAFAFSNFFLWISRSPFRIFIHNSEKVNSLINEVGLKKKKHSYTGMWQVILYTH